MSTEEGEEPPLELAAGVVRLERLANREAQELSSAQRRRELVAWERPPQVFERAGGIGDGDAGSSRDLTG